jgi:hydrogenase 3 maturation protease
MSDDSQNISALVSRLRTELRGAVRERIVVLCVGNVDRGDDGFGPAVAAVLKGRTTAHVFDAGTIPENDLPRIASIEPQVVIIVDAVHFEGTPGVLRLLVPEELRHDDFSTHAGSLVVAAKFLEAACGARVLLLAAQPGSTRYGLGLSEQMQQAVSTAAAGLQEALGERE